MTIPILTQFLFPCTTFIILLLTLNSNFSNSLTLQLDIEVLRAIKQSVDPNSITTTSFINTWNFASDPCANPGIHFLGILCSIPDDQDNINSTYRITSINLEDDSLEGFLTPIIGNLTELTSLNLRTNKFRGPIPETVANLKKLTTLDLSDNYFSGTIPSGLDSLRRLETINLSGNRLSGTIPGSFSNFRRLTFLKLSNNQFTGRIPVLTGLWQLTTLDLSRNQFYGNLPQFPNSLRTLLLGHNILSGHIFSIVRLLKVRELQLNDNRLSGMIYQDILTLPKVTHISLQSNRFTDIEVVRMTNRPSQLEILEVQGNRLRGHLPLNLVTYSNLREINLGHNLFSGEIPLEYGRHLETTWRGLFLEYNMLEGSLPSAFRTTKKRIRCNLAHNCLSCPKAVPMCRGGQRSPSECINRRGL